MKGAPARCMTSWHRCFSGTRAEGGVMELAEDPVCHMKVDPAKARAKAEHQGKTYYFCCPHCAQKFEAEPGRYLAPAAAAGAGLVRLGAAKPGQGAAAHAGAMPSGEASLGGTSSAQGPARDPVCGMSVNPAAAKYKSEQGGETIYFCSPSCRQKFQANPEEYSAAAPSSASAHHTAPATPAGAVAAPATAAVYTCPMDPEVRQPGAGACPKCGMDLEPEVVAAAPVKIEYTCPMHPEIVSDQPGACPICGMDLEPRTITVAAPEQSAELGRSE